MVTVRAQLKGVVVLFTGEPFHKDYSQTPRLEITSQGYWRKIILQMPAWQTTWMTVIYGNGFLKGTSKRPLTPSYFNINIGLMALR